MKRSEICMEKGSLSRLWLVLGELAKNEQGLTLASLANNTGMLAKSTKDTVLRIEKGQLPGLVLKRSEDKKYFVSDWGTLFDKKSFLFFHESLT
jgi:hypothetical protein